MSDKPATRRPERLRSTRPLNAIDLRVGQALLKLRGDRGLTLGEMADALQIEPRLLSAIEAGWTRATAQLLMRVSLRLGVPTSRFYD